MKNVIVVAACLLSCAISFSCTKHIAKENKELLNSVTGTWELRQSSGGMMPGANDYPPGNGNILKFAGATYERYENGQLKQSGVYTIIEDGSVEESVCLDYPDDKFRNRVVYDNDFKGRKIFLQLTTDSSDGNPQLTFVSGCYALDGGSNTVYERQ